MLEQKYIKGTTAVNVARSIEAAAAEGRVASGDLLPAVRALATHLGVSAATVAAAYRILQDRGITVAERRRGTRIRPSAPPALPSTPELPRGVRDLAEGNPDRALLPDLQRTMKKIRVAQRLYGEELNDRALVTLARRHFRADRVPARAIAIVSGALDGVERVLREQLRPGDRVVVEDPCFSGIIDLLAALGLVPVPVEVDDEGMRPEALGRAIRTSAEAVIVTPRAQNPTGASLSKRRAQQLRKVLRARPDLLLIEDDHAGSIAGTPYVTLAEPSRTRWAVVRSASKSLGPDLRVAVVAGDGETIAALERRQTIGMRWVSHILQDVVAALWSDRGVGRRLAIAEKTYTIRRQALLRALVKHGIEATGRSGLNVWIPVNEESAIVKALFQRGWAVQAGERYRLNTPSAIRVTTAALTPADAKRFAADLAAIVSARGRTMAA